MLNSFPSIHRKIRVHILRYFKFFEHNNPKLNAIHILRIRTIILTVTTSKRKGKDEKISLPKNEGDILMITGRHTPRIHLKT